MIVAVIIVSAVFMAASLNFNMQNKCLGSCHMEESIELI